MKFDIVRAWKDEAYRKSLSNKQRDMLPANPVGELTEAEMELVFGGDGGGGGGGGGGVTPAAPAVFHHHTSIHRSTAVVTTAVAGSSVSHVHSFSVICDISVFSLSASVVALSNLLNIANCSRQTCINAD